MKLPKMFTLLLVFPLDLFFHKESSMKKFFYRIRILLPFLIVMILTGCFHHFQMYSGSPKAESEEGTLMNNPQGSGLWIIKVDSIDPGLERGPIKDTQACVLHLLPGEHTVLVTPPYFLMGSASLWFSVSDEDEARAREIIDGWLLKFTVEPGHNYGVGSEHMVWRENEDDIELIIEEADSVYVYRPKDWRNWTPYICDEVPENRVSVIITDEE